MAAIQRFAGLFRNLHSLYAHPGAHRMSWWSTQINLDTASWYVNIAFYVRTMPYSNVDLCRPWHLNPFTRYVPLVHIPATYECTLIFLFFLAGYKIGACHGSFQQTKKNKQRQRHAAFIFFLQRRRHLARFWYATLETIFKQRKARQYLCYTCLSRTAVSGSHHQRHWHLHGYPYTQSAVSQDWHGDARIWFREPLYPTLQGRKKVRTQEAWRVALCDVMFFFQFF